MIVSFDVHLYRGRTVQCLLAFDRVDVHSFQSSDTQEDNHLAINHQDCNPSNNTKDIHMRSSTLQLKQ